MNPSEKNIRNQVIALAAMAQAATLVDKLARTGADNAELAYPLVHGLLETDPRNTESTYLDKNHLRTGLTTLRHLLQQQEQPERDRNYSEILRYMLSMVHLESKLKSRKDMLGAIGKRLQEVRKQASHYQAMNPDDACHGLLHDNVIANIASIYVDTISTFRFRIHVNGNPAHLQQQKNVERIRTMLLCGIRAAVLWRQVGGSRFKLLLNRRQHAEMADALLRLH